MIISDGDIHIYRQSIDAPLDKLDFFRKLLSQDELQRANRFRFDKDRNHFISGRGLLRIILGKYLNESPASVKISYLDKGKPYIESSPVKFNLAHSGGKAFYAFALNIEVGIDLEKIKEMPDAADIAERFFSEDEVNEFRTVEKDNIETAFFNCWTRKEAFIKAIGEGLSHPLADFSVTLKPGDEPKFLMIKNKPDEVKEWSLFDIEAESNFISSLALKAKNVNIIYKELNGFS